MTATFHALPASAAWQHVEARNGFEVLFMQGNRFIGCTTAAEAGEAWLVEYALKVDEHWQTRRAQVKVRSSAGVREVRLDADGHGRWKVDGQAAPHLDGCFDVDLESSAFTNALPVRRLLLPVGAGADTPAVYVRAPDLSVMRLEQRYERIANDGPRERYRYSSATFSFGCDLTFDESGLVLDYPGIAVRVGLNASARTPRS